MGRTALATIIATTAFTASPIRKGITPTINVFDHDIWVTTLSQGTPAP